MAVQRRVNWISQQRVDVPDMRAVESAASNDWDQSTQAFVTNVSQGYIMRGFEISMTGAIGGAASNLQMIMDSGSNPSSVMHIMASQSGTILQVPPGTPAQQLNSSINTNVTGAFSPNALNYVGLDYTRYIDPTTDAQVYLWDPTTNNETTLTAPRAQILQYVINVSTTSWASNFLPVAIVQTDASNNVVSITDCRWLLFRLGTGGADPDPFYQYPWDAQPEGRTENPSTSSSNSVNPFEGGDKMLFSLKDWMNAIMTSILQIQGTTYWYSGSSGGGPNPNPGSLIKLREDAINTITAGVGTITHGVLPNNDPVLSTTGTITATSNQLTALASTTGLVNGLFIFGSGIPAGTTITNIVGSTVTMSNNAAFSAASEPVSFYSPAVVTSPGQINWSDPFYLKVIGAALSYEIAANPSSADILLADDEVAYIILGRDLPVTPNLLYTYPQTDPPAPSPTGYTNVTSVGAISWTAGLLPGDFIRATSDPDSDYAQIYSVDSSTSVTLIGNYVPAGQTAAGVASVYALGSYTASASPSGPRDIYITSRETVPVGQNTFWLFTREDLGGPIPTVYVHFLGSELQYGDSNQIDDGIPKQLLQYIGSPAESQSKPNYTSALIPGSIPEITSILAASAAAITTSQYFYINSSGNARKYYVWYKKDGSGTDPAPQADRIGVEVDITTGETDAQVAVLTASALNNLFYPDFTATVITNTITVTNNSAGETNPAVNGNVGAPFAITVTQNGTGIGNNIVNDGDNLTLAIKKLDEEFGVILANANNPNYDEPLTVISGAPANTNQITGPISPGTSITLPDNSREGELAQLYTVGKGALMLFLNGQYLDLNANESVSGAFASYGMTGPTTSYFNLVTGATQYAIQFTPSSNINLTDVKYLVLSLVPNGCVGNLFSTVQTDSAGQPSGTILGTSSNVAASTIGGSAQTVDFNYGTPVALTSGTPYWFTITGDGTYFAGTNHITLYGPTTPALPDPMSFYNGSAWTSLGSTVSFELDGTSSVGPFDWTEVGADNTLSSQIQINRDLVVGDILTFRINTGSGGGGGGGGGVGPQGPPGVQGPPGANATGGPVNIMTYSSSMGVSTSQNVLLMNCAGGAITLTMPVPSSAAGRIWFIKKIDATANALTLIVSGGGTIDGVSSQSTTVQYYAWTIICDGNSYFLF